MTRRPDSQDRAAAHRRCLCGDQQPCSCTPSPGWRPRPLRPLFWRDLLLIVEILVDALRRALTPRLDEILKEIRIMGAREDAADARQQELIQLVRDGVAAKDAKIAQLQEALANADADKAAALEAESDADAGRQEQVNAALEELAGVQEPPADSGDGSAPVENPPADSGDGSAPVDSPPPADAPDGSAPVE